MYAANMKRLLIICATAIICSALLHLVSVRTFLVTGVELSDDGLSKRKIKEAK